MDRILGSWRGGGLLLLAYHRLLRKLLDLLDGLRCPLLEAHAVYALVHVDGVLAGDNIGDGRAAGLARGLRFGRHSRGRRFWLANLETSLYT